MCASHSFYHLPQKLYIVLQENVCFALILSPQKTLHSLQENVCSALILSPPPKALLMGSAKQYRLCKLISGAKRKSVTICLHLTREVDFLRSKKDGRRDIQAIPHRFIGDQLFRIPAIIDLEIMDCLQVFPPVCLPLRRYCSSTKASLEPPT